MSKKIRIFVAMPGTTMGDDAPWNKPADIITEFYEKIRESVQGSTNMETELIIEKEKQTPDPYIHESMFNEAQIADVYIADLTGDNANVFLELGVRWALRCKVTIRVSQIRTKPYPFNVQGGRIFTYSADPKELKSAIIQISTIIVKQLPDDDYCDSPVRKNNTYLQIKSSELIELKNKIKDLEAKRGEDYLAAARKSSDSNHKISLLIQAIETNPYLINAYIELGIEYRKNSKPIDSIEILNKGVEIDNNDAGLFQQLGISYGKAGDLQSSLDKLVQADKLRPNDAEILGNLGGAYRRKGLADLPKSIDWPMLQESLNKYEEASNIDKNNTYSLLNIAKLQLMLERFSSGNKNKAESNLRRIKYLSLAALEDDIPEKYWKKFDLGDTLILLGEFQFGINEYEEAYNSIPEAHKGSVIKIVISSLIELYEVGLENKDIMNCIKDVIQKYS